MVLRINDENARRLQVRHQQRHLLQRVVRRHDEAVHASAEHFPLLFERGLPLLAQQTVQPLFIDGDELGVAERGAVFVDHGKVGFGVEHLGGDVDGARRGQRKRQRQRGVVLYGLGGVVDGADLQEVGEVPDEQRVANVGGVVGERERARLRSEGGLFVLVLLVDLVVVLVAHHVEVQPVHAVVAGNPVVVVVHREDQAIAAQPLHNAPHHDAHAVVEHHYLLSGVDIRERQHVGKRIEAQIATNKSNRASLL